MTTTMPEPVPMTTLTAVLDALTQWLARHDAHPTYCTVSTEVYPSIDVHASRATMPPDILESLGFSVARRFTALHEVHESWHLTLRTTTGVRWDIKAVVALGPVEDWGHLLDDDAEEEW